MAWRQLDVSESVLINEINNVSIQHSFEYLHQHRGGLLNIVATGKTGEGKSATLNTLLTHSSNPNGFFKEDQSPDSVTKKHSDRAVDLFGMNCRLIDTIGLFDTEETLQRNPAEFMQVNDVVDHHKVVLQSLAAVISLCSDGIDAFLIVIKGTERLTFESKETMKVILRYFGGSMLDHCIFVLTNADQAEKGDTLKKMESKIKQYLRTIGYIPDVSDRFVHFDNRNRPKQHVVNLLKAIEVNLQKLKGIPYTNIAFKHAQKVLAAERVKLKNEMEAQLQKCIQVETDKVRNEYQREIETVQRQLDEKAQLISKLSANAAEERKKFQGEINGLNSKLINLEKNREKDIDAAVQKSKAECDKIYHQQYRMMENCFQEQNRMMTENSKIVEVLQQLVTALLNRPPVVEHHYHYEERCLLM